MKNLIKAALLISLLGSTAYSQSPELQNFVEQGVRLHDKGDYNGAIEQYKKALLIDDKSPLANYEIGSTYFALTDYQKAMEHADKVIAANTSYLEQAYVLKGTVLDVMGKPDEAIKVYNEAIKSFPNKYLPYYNLAVTSYSIKEYKNAEEALKKSVTLNPSHASSHLLMGYTMDAQNSRTKSLLAVYNFLLLEPKGNRAKTACKLLDFLLKKNVKKDNEKSVTITFDPGKSSDEFSSAELMLSLMEAGKTTEKNKGKSEQELFSENTKSFFSILGELKKDNTGFWWDYYVDFFYAMTNDKHTETYCYYIMQSNDDEKINGWLKNNDEKVESLSNWYSNFKRKL